MAGICSAHLPKVFVPSCKACNAHPRDIFPNWDEMSREAKLAGEHKCECGFVYYKTVDLCPKCSQLRIK